MAAPLAPSSGHHLRAPSDPVAPAPSRAAPFDAEAAPLAPSSGHHLRAPSDPVAPAPSRAAPFDASAWLLHATFSGPSWALDGAPAPPWPGASRGAGWREFSRAELLACAARVGGVGFVGDSVMRETFNALLRLAGSCTCSQEACCVDSRVPHAEQAHEAAFDAGGGATARLSFRFARNAGAELGERVAGLLDGGAAAIVAGSGFWDLNPGQGGAAAERAVTGYAARLAAFLRGLRPRVTRNHTLVWREITPTVFSRAPDDRRSYLTPGRTAALNAVARRLLMEGWAGGGGGGGGALPPWRVVDADLLIPWDQLEALVSADGYHPEGLVLLNVLHAIFSELCPPFGDWREAVDGMPPERRRL
jgi:hypothetical protein